MLTTQDNELLTRVGPGTPMGNVLREYWLPLMLSSELPEPDAEPKRVRLLGEDLIAFRNTSDEVGLVANACPHRGASLFFGRNEENGLRCVYHGWKFDTEGNCVDMPNEPAESNFKHKIHIQAYTVRERNGVLWAYLGAKADLPELPAIEWNLVPENQRFISMRIQECNWAQAFEGGIDSSHSGFLHSPVSSHRAKSEKDYDKDPNLQAGRRGSSKGMIYKARDKHPVFEVVDTPYGELIGARRNAEEDSYYWRITQFLMPFYSMIPSYGEDPVIGGHAWVPLDDYTTLTWSVDWHPLRALTNQEIAKYHDYPRGAGIHPGTAKGLLPASSKPYGAWYPKDNARNDYGLDHELQKDTLFCGIPNLGLQDSAMQEGMGAIFDRSKEHLGSSDMGIIRARRRLLGAARALQDSGTPPAGVDASESYRVRPAGVVLARTAVWAEAAQEYVIAHREKHHASA
ncbi:MAG: aromatic ring-hydroxylating dioxygenase subunit alpha [Dehalococcoidia bacterium]|nr:aromatic ring-hydroxylating dioxygenase subunit alpha [Dehalococcoidia bacterium]